ncbi:MAG TPA: RiPP maturation radical SAM C-methyltransferase [Streptosporangiaceae bacterium]|jgi:ribosomal peptide maturation radical SAM protein 1
MRVLLINTPWARLEVPSLGLGILRGCLARDLPEAEVDVLNVNLDYVDWAVQRGPFTLADYNYLASDNYFSGYGDWVFSSALYDDPGWRVAEFRALHGDQVPAERLEWMIELHALAPEFTLRTAELIAAAAPDLVGFTSTFQQNTAALATARQLKRLRPDTAVVFGGANCDGPQGAALHRNFPFVDFVVCGEGENTFPALIRALYGDGDLAAIPGLCLRGPQGSMATPASPRPLTADQIVPPDYAGFYERLRTSPAHRWVEPKLVVEGSRGCWWGEKHHCRFCGLNGTSMEFRSKSPTRFGDEILELARRHHVLDFIVVDNIMDMGYLTSVLPDLTASGWDLRLHFEIKSNLRREQLRVLLEAGVMHVQPGIENLSTHVLHLMDKGVSGCQNVRMLRDAESLGLTVDWNYLYGFPGETEQDYQAVIDQLPALHHLPPTPGRGTRIAIERFSPYFNRPDLGFAELAPDKQYALIYDLPADQLRDLAYMFDAPRRGIEGAVEDRLGQALADWMAAYPCSRLNFWELGQEIMLASDRRAFGWSVLRLTDPVEVAAFGLLDQPHTAEALARKLDVSDATGLLERWLTLGLVFTEAGRYVHIATAAGNQRLLHPGRVVPEPVAAAAG